MPALQRDIEIEQGSKFELELTYTEDGVPRDLSADEARFQVRSSYDAPTTLLSLIQGSGITLGANGKLLVEASAVVTAALTPQSAVYDLELVPDGVAADAIKVLKGKAVITPEVSK